MYIWQSRPCTFYVVGYLHFGVTAVKIHHGYRPVDSAALAISRGHDRVQIRDKYFALSKLTKINGIIVYLYDCLVTVHNVDCLAVYNRCVCGSPKWNVNDLYGCTRRSFTSLSARNPVTSGEFVTKCYAWEPYMIVIRGIHRLATRYTMYGPNCRTAAMHQTYVWRRRRPITYRPSSNSISFSTLAPGHVHMRTNKHLYHVDVKCIPCLTKFITILLRTLDLLKSV